MKARDLFKSYRFDEAVVAYEEDLRAETDRAAAVDGMGDSLMAVGRYADAIPYLTEATDRAHALLQGNMGREIELSVCEWITGSKREAMTRMSSLVEGTMSGSIGYARDLAGGAVQALLLRYMAFSLGESRPYATSVAFLTELADGKRSGYWPGPVAQFAFGRISMSSALTSGLGTDTLDLALEMAKDDLLKRRRLCNVLFNVAVNARIEGRESECSKWMRECADLRNPLVEYDWHLAAAEVKTAGSRDTHAISR